MLNDELMPSATFHSICVYTIRDGVVLEEDWLQGGTFSFAEGKRWVRARAELQSAQRAGRVMPVIFADARYTSRLIFFANLEDIQMGATARDGTTAIVASGLSKFADPPKKSLTRRGRYRATNPSGSYPAVYRLSDPVVAWFCAGRSGPVRSRVGGFATPGK